MRILALSLKNLNSLQGEWHIDFRHPAYSENGIFAITGQTGAGKSTILDAICLALYGQTPRLGELTQSRNDLMSRQTGECWAKVIFSTQGKTYLCDWSQKRAHGKGDGKLQSPKHSISEYLEDEKGENIGKILEEKAKSTKPKIQSITGMDFQQFTRSMMLAQGSFAAFLQAKSEERSEILEQITGSEIYSEISIRVNSHRSEAKKDLDNLQAQQSGMMLLTEEEEQQALEKQQDFTAEIGDLKQQIKLFTQIKDWQLNLKTTQSDSEQNRLALEKINQEIAHFTPQRQRLQLAEQAYKLTGEYAKLQHDRQQQTKLLQNQTQLQTQLPILEQQLTEQKQQLSQAETAKIQTETAWQSAQPKLNHAKKLAVQIDGLTQQIENANAQYTSQINEQMDLANLLENGNDELIELQHQQNQYQQEQKTLINHATLPEIVANLRQYLQTLAGNENQLNALQSQQNQSQTALTQFSQILADNQTQLANFTQKNSQFKAELDKQTQQLAEILAGKIGEEWHVQGNILLQAKNSLSNINQQWQIIQQLQQEKIELEQEQSNTQTALSKVESEYNKLQNDHQKQNQLVELLGEKQLLQAKIDDLESERENLIEGEPCPLCGATDHPFATQSFTSQTDSIKTELTTAKKQLKVLENDTKNTSLKQNSLSERLQQIQQNLSKNKQNLTHQFEQLKKSLAEFNQIIAKEDVFTPQETAVFVTLQTMQKLENSAFFQSNFTQSLAESQTILAQNQTEIAQKIQQIGQLQASVTQLKTDFDNQQQKLFQLEKAQSDITYQQAIETQKLNHLTEQIGSLYYANQQLEEKISQTVQPFAEFLSARITGNFAKNLSQMIEILSQRQHYWQNLEKNISNNAQTITALQTRLQQQNEVYEKTKILLSQSAIKIQEQEQILHQRIAEKFNLFGDSDIELEEKHLSDNLNFTQTAFFNTEKMVQKTEHELVNLQHNFTQISAELNQLAKQITEQETQLKSRWQVLGFTDETAFLQASLNEDEREQLTKTARQLDERLHFLTEQQLQLQQKLADLQQHPLSQTAKNTTAEQLSEQLTQATQELENLQQQLGAIQQQLTHNQSVKASQSQLVAQIQTQQKIWQDWNNLYDLIGSSDGKKFRNFAQGLTFNVMINHANAQLGRMSDRYLLVADTQNPLELNVIDNYQGGEVRTSKNLSGGESFIVSLALALGLSAMASRQVQVDSLFLDEGFGTLDAEALDTALDTLTSLQQSGKLIGVISHVQELKDRITTQIVVEKMRGGVSQVTGAGVTRI